MKKNQRINIFNPNSLFNNIVHADELIDVIFYSVKENNIKNITVNISSNNPIKFITVVNFLLKKTKNTSKIIILKAKNGSKYYSTKLQNFYFKKKISNVKKTLLMLFIK